MKKINGTHVGFIVIALMIVTIPSCSAMFAYNTEDFIVATITDKERVVTGSGENTSSKYLIFTDVETFENSDSLWYLKFNSSDLYGKVQVGYTYKFKVYGWRIPFMSSYRNIVDYEVVRDNKVPETISMMSETLSLN